MNGLVFFVKMSKMRRKVVVKMSKTIDNIVVKMSVKRGVDLCIEELKKKLKNG